MSSRMRNAVAATILLPHLALAQAASPAPGTSVSSLVRDLPVADQQTQRVLYLRPPNPRGTIVMLPGGAGTLGIGSDGRIDSGDNFVVRTRESWAAEGYAVILPDSVDHRSLRARRNSPWYAAIVGRLVGFARAEAPGPVFLLGTSQGSIAAMNGAATLSTGAIAGLVLTESVSRQGGSHETVFDAHPDQVSVPALVVANSDDRCDVAPPGDAPSIARSMTHSPDSTVLAVSGGVERSRSCGSLSPHGYYGIEGLVIAAIVAWMNRHN